MKSANRERITWLFLGILVGILLSGFVLLLLQKPTPPLPALFTNRINDSSVFFANQQIVPCPSENSSLSINKININTVSKVDLTGLPGIGEVKANAIIEFRQRYGPFKSIDEILYVPGINESLYTQICALISVEP